MTLEADKAQDITSAIGAVYSEMDYQMVRWLESVTGRHPHDRSIDEWYLYIEQYAREGAAQTTYGDEQGAVDTLRKVAAMAMIALAQNGSPHRVMPTAAEFQALYAEYRQAPSSRRG